MGESPHRFYSGEVFHRRLIDPAYSFRYGVFSLLLDIDKIDQLDGDLRLFSRNRFNLFSFYDQDHLTHKTSGELSPTLREWVENALREGGLSFSAGRIRLFCFPRILGFVFNPLSVFYCEDEEGRLQAIICGVRNTFGERHCYLLKPSDHQDLRWSTAYRLPKRFHVSPFLPIAGEYEFRFSEPGPTLDVGIVWIRDSRRAMIATQRMQSRPVSSGTLIKAWLRWPMMTLKVVWAIHWQALKIWLRGGRFHAKPRPPVEEISTDV